MATLNKYGSITETFIGDPFIHLPALSAKATPPADLNLVLADFNLGVPLYAGISGAFQKGKFRLNDLPRIVGVGLWCNIADGLVQIDDPDNELTGLVFQVNGSAYDSADVLVQPTLFTDTFQVKIQEFNHIYEVDRFITDLNLDYTLTGEPAASGSGYYRLDARFIALSSDFATITVHPDFAAKPFYIRPMVVVEHSFPMGLLP